MNAFAHPTGTGGGGGAGGGGTSRTTTSRPTATSSPATTQAPTTTAPRFVVTLWSGLPTVECTMQPDGRWHFRARFQATIWTLGAGTVRYQWGRGGGDVRSDVTQHDVDRGRDGYRADFIDLISGSAPSSTDTVTDRLHVLDPHGTIGQPVVVEMTHTICP
jgi:hypothetical protein